MLMVLVIGALVDDDVVALVLVVVLVLVVAVLALALAAAVVVVALVPVGGGSILADILWRFLK